MSNFSVSQRNRNIRARVAAQAAVEGLAVKPTGRVQYRSRGRVAVIGEQVAMEFATRLSDPLKPQVILLQGAEEPGPPLISVGGRTLRIEGYLGAFTISLGEEGKPNYETVEVDLILDLSPKPIVSVTLTPPGYLMAGTEEPSLQAAEQQLVELVGTFEKPRYFDYDASICAHARAGQEACNRCIEACPAEAITSLAESIKVNPNLCQGGGICASVCPTGAIRYNYPSAADTLDRIRTVLRVYGENGGQYPVVAFVAEEDTEFLPAAPSNLLTVVVEELASIGLETWLATLAYGARCVLLINGGSVPAMVQVTLDEQLATAGAILNGLGYAPNAIRFITTPALPEECESTMPDMQVAHFAGLTEKRRVAFLAIDHLYSQAPAASQILSLPQGSPFGIIKVDEEACTLCMGCTSICPVNAVQAGNETPALLFHEASCVQCGMCASACPENAISLEPRLVADPELRDRTVTLHEEPPFCCVSCGKPFATNSMINKMLSKLEGHWMFQDERARRRLMMCDDCRVVDIAQDPEAMEQGFDTHHRQ